MPKNYDTTGANWNNPLNNGSSGGLLTWLDHSLDWFAFGDSNATSNLFGELTGYNSQQREFEQQEYLMDKQNAYNTPAAQMARMREAGINPNTAAAGIAGGGNESAQAPAVSNATGAPAAGVGAAAQMLSSVAGVPSQLADAREKDANANLHDEEANRISTLLPNEVQLSLENIGLVRGQAQAIAIENKFRPQSLMLDIAQKRLTLPILRQQFKVLKGQYANELAQAKLALQEVEESKGRVGLLEYQKALMSAQSMRETAEANYISQKFQLLKNYGWDASTGLGGLLAGQFVIGDDPDAVELSTDDLLNTIFKLNFSENYGLSQGQLDARKGLVVAQREAEEKLIEKKKDATSEIERKKPIWQGIGTWTGRPSIGVGVGPFRVNSGN